MALFYKITLHTSPGGFHLGDNPITIYIPSEKHIDTNQKLDQLLAFAMQYHASEPNTRYSPPDQISFEAEELSQDKIDLLRKSNHLFDPDEFKR